jgi:hypothetical protein
VTDDRGPDQNPPAGSIDVMQTPDRDGYCWQQQSENNETCEPAKSLASYRIGMQKISSGTDAKMRTRLKNNVKNQNSDRDARN